MSSLMNTSWQELSTAIRGVTPIKYETVRVENRLLDGSMHVQIIGTPAKFITFDVLANYEQVNLLNYAASIAEQVKLTFDGVTYRGLLQNISEDRITAWNRDKGKVFYIINGIRLDIAEDGLI